MHATFCQRFDYRDQLRIYLFLGVAVMFIALSGVWILNVLILNVIHQSASKSSPCFTDGDCPSALQICEYGSWKGLGTCRIMPVDSFSANADIKRHEGSRRRIIGRQLLRRKRNPFMVRPGYYLPQTKRRTSSSFEEDGDRHDMLLLAIPGEQSSALVDGVVTDLLRSRRSLITVNGVNLTVALKPVDNSGSDWLILVTRDLPTKESGSGESTSMERYGIGDLQLIDGINVLKHNAAQALLEESSDSFVDAGPTVNISVHYPVYVWRRSQAGHAGGTRLRIRRQLPMRSAAVSSIDPLLNQILTVDPVIPAAEDILTTNVNKRSSVLSEAGPRAWRQLEDIEHQVSRPLPEVVTEPEEGPVAVEDLFVAKEISSLRQKRQPQKSARMANIHEPANPSRTHRTKLKTKRKVNEQAGGKFPMRGRRAKTRRGAFQKRINHDIPKKHIRLAGQYKHDSSHQVQAPSQADLRQPRASEMNVASPLQRLSRHKAHHHTRSALHRQHSEHASKPFRQIRDRVKSVEADYSKHENDHRSARGRHIKLERKRKSNSDPSIQNLESDPGRSRFKHSEPGHTVTPLQTVTTLKNEDTTTDIPDPFSDVDKQQSLPVAYYDMSKRDLDGDADFDPEVSIHEVAANDDDLDHDDSRRKRQTVADEIEDESDLDIPSWRETVEMLRRANTFAVPAHDSNGHVILVRRVRDLGVLDLGESLSKLRETMAKIFGRCSPARRRKRSQRGPTEVVTDQLSNQETWEIHGQKDEVMDQAKINMEMDDDKPYNVTTVFRPMGKRNNKLNAPNKRTQNKRIHRKVAGSGYSRDIRNAVRSAKQPKEIRDLNHFEKHLEHARRQGGGKIALNSYAYSKRKRYSKTGRHAKASNIAGPHKRQQGENEQKRNDYNIPLNQKVRYKVPTDSDVGIKLSVDKAQPQSKPVVSAKLSSDKGATGPLKKRSKTRVLKARHDPHTRDTKPFAKCISCHVGPAPRIQKGLNNLPTKLAREPYIITRKYNDSKARKTRVQESARKPRGIDVSSDPDRVRLLYLVNGDAAPVDRPMMNVKRDLDVSAEVKTVNDDHTTSDRVVTSSPPSTTVDAMIVDDDHDDVFVGDQGAVSVEADTIITESEGDGGDPTASKVVIFSGEDAGESAPSAETEIKIPSPVSASDGEIVTISVNGTSDNAPKSAMADAIIVPGGEIDWSLSGSSDHLMDLISDVEKALRVPLGDSDSLDDITVIDDNNVVYKSSPSIVSTLRRISRPENELSARLQVNRIPALSAQKETILTETDKIYPPLPITENLKLTAIPHESPVMNVQAYRYVLPEPSSIDEINEKIRIKGFDHLRRPFKPVFVDSVANKMVWIEPSYKTSVSAEVPKYEKPTKNRAYLRLYGNGLKVKPPVTLVKIANGKQVVSEVHDSQDTTTQIIEQPSGEQITDTATIQMSEKLESPQVYDIHGNIAVNGQLLSDAVPQVGEDTAVKVISSVSIADSDPIDVVSPLVAVAKDGDDDLLVDKFQSNVHILRHPGYGGQVFAAVGARDAVVQKKDVEEATRQPAAAPVAAIKRSAALNSAGLATSPKQQSTDADENENVPRRLLTSRQLQNKGVNHVYRVPQAAIGDTWKRLESGAGMSIATRAANRKQGNSPPAQPANQVNGPLHQGRTPLLQQQKPAQQQQAVKIYSQDPGVKGATVDMLKSLTSKLVQQSKTNSSTTSPVHGGNIACISGKRGCKQKRHSYPVMQKLSPRSMHDHFSPLNLRTFSQHGSSANYKSKMKRDISQAAFEKRKVFFSNPRIIYEAPGSRYLVPDVRGRSERSHKAQLFTETIETGPRNKNRLLATSLPSDHAPGSSYGLKNLLGGTPSLPEAHEKALQEAEQRTSFKVIDSEEGFSAHKPTFHRKVSGGGDIVVKQMDPIFPKMREKSKPWRPGKGGITVATDVKQHAFEYGGDLGGVAVSFINGNPFPSPPSSEPSDATHNRADKRQHREVLHEQTKTQNHREKSIGGQETANTQTSSLRKKRRLIGGNEANQLRTELHNLNRIGTGMGLKLLNNDSIEKIVKEETKRGVHAKSKRKVRRKKNVAPRDSSKRRNSRFAVRLPSHSDFTNLRKMGSKSTRATGRLKLRATPNSDRRVNSNSVKAMQASEDIPFTKGKASMNLKEKKRDTGFHKSNHNSLQLPTNTQYTRKLRTPSETVVSIPNYKYAEEVRHDHVPKITNPELHDQSNDRESEEMVSVSSEEGDPIMLSAVLRTRRRRKRELFTRGDFPAHNRAAVRRGLPAGPVMIPAAEPMYSEPVEGAPRIPVSVHRRQDMSRHSSAHQLAERSFGGPKLVSSARQLAADSTRSASPAPTEEQLRGHGDGVGKRQMIGERQQLLKAIGPGRATNPVADSLRGQFTREKQRSPKRVAERNNFVIKSNSSAADAHQTANHAPVKVTKIATDTIPGKTKVFESRPKPKNSAESVWKRLGEIFDISPKEPVEMRPGTSGDPTSTTSPLPEINSVHKFEKGGEDAGKLSVQAIKSGLSHDPPSKSGLRAAIVDRLLQDLRKMSSARGSEMARAESDLIEILHDYQMDLMDEDEETVAGEPFQGVRIHDNVAIPVVYPAVPIKLEGRPHHHIVIRSARHGPARHTHRSPDQSPLNPP